jgi:hypothetical protein
MSDFEYAGHSFLLHELKTNTAKNVTINKTAIFFISDSIILYILKTIFVPKIKSPLPIQRKIIA